MKKLSIIAATLAVGMLALVGCKSDEAETETSAATEETGTVSDSKFPWGFEAKGYVELCDYKGLTATKSSTEVTDDEVNMYIEYILSYNTTSEEVTDRDDVQSGDIANIDYLGKIDGEAFDSGTAQGYDLTIGSGQFIPGFEDQLIGMKKGETKDIEVTFPEEYSENLAGKDAVFTVTINSISRTVTPELTDEFVQQFDQGMQTAEEFRQRIKDEIAADKENTSSQSVLAELQQQLMDGSKVIKDIPESYVTKLYNSSLEDLKSLATSYQTDVGTIANYYYGVSAENYETELLTKIKDEVAPQYMVLYAIAEIEDITVPADSIDSEIQKMIDNGETGEITTIDEYKGRIGDLETFREYLIMNKVFDFLEENAVINEE